MGIIPRKSKCAPQIFAHSFWSISAWTESAQKEDYLLATVKLFAISAKLKKSWEKKSSDIFSLSVQPFFGTQKLKSHELGTIECSWIWEKPPNVKKDSSSVQKIMNAQFLGNSFVENEWKNNSSFCKDLTNKES